MSVFEGKRVSVSAEMHIPFPAEVIWPQLCPVREYDWIEVWQCDVLHTESGYNELGCVFRTDFPTEFGEEIWLTSRFDVNERLEFVRTNAARVIHFVITLEPDGGGTKMVWAQDVTALNEQGNEYVEDKAEAFAAQMGMLEKFLSHYLETGEMLKGGNIGLMEKIKSHVHGRTTG